MAFSLRDLEARLLRIEQAIERFLGQHTSGCSVGGAASAHSVDQRSPTERNALFHFIDLPK